MIDSIKSFIDNNVVKSSHIIVALSGGPDSVCLLVQLNSIKSIYNFTLSAAYINHGIRNTDDNLKDYTLVRELTERLSIPLYTKEFKQNELFKRAQLNGNSMEAIAREVRYEFFNSLIKDDKTYIALGHNRDDQIETQIMRFFQGSSIEGLLGIKSVNGSYIRPMISISKKEILSFLQKKQIPYNIDITNLENNYLRNKVRNQLIPLIGEVFPGYNKSLQNLEREFEMIHQILAKGYSADLWLYRDRCWHIDYKTFVNFEPYYRKKLIYDIFDKTYSGKIKDYRLPDRFLKNLTKQSFKNGERVLEGHGFILERVGYSLVWSRIVRVFETFYSEVFGPCILTIKNKKITFSDSLVTSDTNIKGLTYPFVIKTITTNDRKLIKKFNLTLDDRDTFIIEKSYNNIYAIISNNRVVYNKESEIVGISVKIESL